MFWLVANLYDEDPFYTSTHETFDQAIQTAGREFDFAEGELVYLSLNGWIALDEFSVLNIYEEDADENE